MLDNISPFLGQLMPKLYMSFAEGDGGSGDAGDGGSANGDGNAGAVGDKGASGSLAFDWKAKLGDDLSKAPSLQKFENTEKGLVEAAKSYVNLEKLLGNEKVPLPKDADDTEGLAAFNKAIGVPEKAEGYALPDAKMPDGVQTGFDKGAFQGIMHKYGLRPDQAEGLWNEYTGMAAKSIVTRQNELKSNMDKNINALRAEWGDAYAGNIELGDMLINKFADDQEMGDWLTSTLGSNPYGMKFLAKIGTQFSENKIGDFQYKRFSMTPEEAQNEVARIKNDPQHPYNSEKATEKDHQMAVDHVNRLIAISMGKKV